MTASAAMTFSSVTVIGNAVFNDCPSIQAHAGAAFQLGINGMGVTLLL